MFIQTIILLLTSLSVYLISLNNNKVKYGFLIGLLVQPFWFYETYKNNMWGMFFLSFFYSYSYWNGYRNQINKNKSND